MSLARKSLWELVAPGMRNVGLSGSVHDSLDENTETAHVNRCLCNSRSCHTVREPGQSPVLWHRSWQAGTTTVDRGNEQYLKAVVVS